MKILFLKLKFLTAIILIGLVQISMAKNNEAVSLEEASETIRKQTKGQVLSATTKFSNGVKSHRIQVLTESGRVKIYHVPANKKNSTQTTDNYRYNQSSNYRNINPNYSQNNTPNNLNNRNSRNSNNKQTNSNRTQRTRPQYNSNNRNTRNNPKRLKTPSNENGDRKKK